MSLKSIITFTVLWLCITQLFTWYSFNRTQLTQPDKKTCAPSLGCNHKKPHPLMFLDMHVRWDAAWYIDIAKTGYSYSPHQQSNVNFFPLYPLLIWLTHFLFLPFTTQTNAFIIGGMLLSWIFLLCGVLMLYKLFRLDHTEDTTSLAIIFLLIFPTAFVLTALYTEALFLFLSTTCLYLTRKKYLFLAALIGFLASLTRSVGVLLAIPIAIEFLYHIRKNQVNKISLLFVLLIPLGTITYMMYLFYYFGDPFLFIKAATQWGRHLNNTLFISSLVQHFINQLYFTPASAANMLLEVFFLIIGISGSILLIKHERVSYGVWALVSVLFPLLSGVLVSQGRYTLVIFPLFLVFAKLANDYPLFKYTYLLISILLLGIQTTLFVNGYWAG